MARMMRTQTTPSSAEFEEIEEQVIGPHVFSKIGVILHVCGMMLAIVPPRCSNPRVPQNSQPRPAAVKGVSVELHAKFMVRRQRLMAAAG